MTSATAPLRLQSSVVSFLEVVMNELNDSPWISSGARAGADAADAAAAARVRECLHYDLKIDLFGLARQTGLSRFQVLRAFKRRYGMPPHAYQLRARIGLAQRALKAGQTPADVAAQLGFVDQSHLCRHFKRLVGVTPARYARAAGTPPQPRS
jgi:AraC-like DNA-binding protein